MLKKDIASSKGFVVKNFVFENDDKFNYEKDFSNVSTNVWDFAIFEKKKYPQFPTRSTM